MGELVDPRETVSRQTTLDAPNAKFSQTQIVETFSTATQTPLSGPMMSVQQNQAEVKADDPFTGTDIKSHIEIVK